MQRLPARTLVALIAAVTLAVLSVVSAHRMGPDRDMLQRQVTLHVLGGTAAELCGTADAAHDHRCPFCHKLPDVPRVQAPAGERRVAFAIEDRAGGHLVLGPQHIAPHVTLRGPPRTV